VFLSFCASTYKTWTGLEYILKNYNITYLQLFFKGFFLNCRCTTPKYLPPPSFPPPTGTAKGPTTEALPTPIGTAKGATEALAPSKEKAKGSAEAVPPTIDMTAPYIDSATEEE
jgi:hypothetical protein